MSFLIFRAYPLPQLGTNRKEFVDDGHYPIRFISYDINLEELKKIDKELYDNCVPECVYRGFCPEIFPCNNGKGRVNTPKYIQWRKDYIGNRIKIKDN